jgi:hypothetical protein
MSTLTISENEMFGDTTRHRAAVQHGAIVSGGPTAWAVTWLPGRLLTRNQAITAMTIAEAVAGIDFTPEFNRSPIGLAMWGQIDSWAEELGLPGANAVAFASMTPEDYQDGTVAGE